MFKSSAGRNAGLALAFAISLFKKRTSLILGSPLLFSLLFFNQVKGQTFAPYTSNPFSLLGNGTFVRTAFADLDGDGDFDLLTATDGGTNGSAFIYYENTGTSKLPVYAAGIITPFGLNQYIGAVMSPVLVDIDQDGDFDMFVGNQGGETVYYQNTGTAKVPIFATPVIGAFGLYSVGYFSAPTFADLDNDGDLDVLIGEYYGNMYYFQNNGTAKNPQFVGHQAFPFGLTNVGNAPKTVFVDMDKDGDSDLMVGTENGDFYYFQNTGTLSAPLFAAATKNPFGLSNVGSQYNSPTFADMDGDGDIDILSGDHSNTFKYFQNTSPVNFSPVLSGLDGDHLAWPGLGQTDFLDVGSNAAVSDPEFEALNGGAGDWAGASLVLKQAGSAVAKNLFNFLNYDYTFTVSGSDLQSDGLTFATFTNTGGMLTINFTSSAKIATTAMVNDVIRHITYRNDTPVENANVLFSLSDGNSHSDAKVLVTASVLTVDDITADVSSGTLGLGQTLDIKISFNSTVIVTGIPTLALNSGGIATYVSGSGTGTLTFRYTIGAGNTAADLDYTNINALALNGGTIKGYAANPDVLILPAPGAAGSLGANTNLIIDTEAPSVLSVSTTTANGTYPIGTAILIDVTFSEPVDVVGSAATLDLNLSPAAAAYSGGTGTNTLSFNYTVADGQSTADLDYLSSSALQLNGSTIKDAGGNDAHPGLPTPGVAGSLGAAKDIVINTSRPHVASIVKTDAAVSTNSTSVNFTVTFSEAVTGVDVSDFKSTLTGISGAFITSVSTVNSIVYTVGVNTGMGSGSLRLDLAGSAGITSLIGNPIVPGGYISGEIYTIDKIPPAVPSGLTVNAGNQENVLNWTGVTDAVKYNIMGGTTSTTVNTVLATITGTNLTYTHTGLTNGSTYYYALQSIDNIGNVSATSMPSVTGTPKSGQVITFNPLSPALYGSSFTLVASSSSGLPVTFSSSDTHIATISGTTVTIVGAGQVSILANQAGSGAYTAAAEVVQPITISPVNITVSANAETKVFGQADPSFSATLSPQLLPGDAATGSLSRVSGSNVGTYMIKQGTFSLDPLKYTTVYVGANLTITPQPVNITASGPLTKTYLDLDPVFNYTNTALQGSDVITGEIGRTAGDNVGTYALTLGTLTAGSNYSLILQGNPQFSITQTIITVVPRSINKKFGDVEPVFVYDYTPALKTGDAFTGTLERSPGEQAGVYTLNQGTLALRTNYVLKVLPENFTIKPKPITITAASVSKTYGEADPSFNYIATPALITGNSYSGALSRAAGEDVGTYDLNMGTLAVNSNYVLSLVPGAQLSIGRKNIMVAAEAKSISYGDADPQLSYTFSPALQPGDNFTGSLIRAAGNNVGTYAISQGSLNLSSNYTLSFTAKELHINPVALKITADNKERFAGTVNPVLTASYEGFVNGENNTVFTTQPVLATTAVLSSTPGTYDIIASSAVAANYSISYLKGVMTIKAGAPTDISLRAVVLYEKAIAGTNAGTLSSASTDESATFSYTLVAGSGDTDNSSFVIVGNKINTTSPLHYVTQANYTIRVRATTQYGLWLEKVLSIALTDVNDMPTLAAIGDQTICYTRSTQNVALTGISAGPETGQTTNLSVTTSNSAMFDRLTLSGSGSTGTLSYQPKTGAAGTATVTVTVKDNGGTANGGVDMNSRTFLITVNALPILTINSDKGTSVSKGETVLLNATGAANYVWATDNSIVNGLNSAILQVRPRQTTTYRVTGTNASGCSETQNFTITVLDDLVKIKATNILTPNGDGYNDKWLIDNIDFYPNNEVKVFDRSGRVVYSKKGYDNSWEGTLNGTPLAEGTYYYVIDFGTERQVFKGYITIVRQN